MARKKFLTYKSEQLKYYIEQRSNEEINVLTLAQIERIGLSEFEDEEYIYMDIDLTSTMKLLLNDKKISSYGIENFIQFFVEFENVQFIVDEKYKEELIDTLPYIFSTGFPIELEVKVSLEEPPKEKGEWSVKEKKRIVDLEGNEITGLIEYMDYKLIGHQILKKDIESKIKEFIYFFGKIKDQPIISFFLLGPSGLGKTEVARIMHNYLGSGSPLAKINFGNYSSESSLASLIGSPPGYRNSEQDSDLIIKIKNSYAGVIVIDEFEKADRSVHNFFLQLLEEGKFDDAMGRIFDLSGYVIVFTSNLKRDEYSESLSPELRSRFNGVYLMDELKESEKEQYAKSIVDRYFEATKEESSEEKKDMILEGVNLKKENNLRTLKQKLRTAFYRVNNLDKGKEKERA